MKKLLIGVALAALAGPAIAADVGVSINIGQPGFYGRIDLGNNYPPPRVIYQEPRVIERVQVVEEPIYLRVPQGHRKHWDQHCREYDACGRRVYFVQDNWYNDVYAPHYRHEHGDDDRHDDGDRHDHDDDHGHGNDHDNGHGHGHKGR